MCWVYWLYPWHGRFDFTLLWTLICFPYSLNSTIIHTSVILISWLASEIVYKGNVWLPIPPNSSFPFAICSGTSCELSSIIIISTHSTVPKNIPYCESACCCASFPLRTLCCCWSCWITESWFKISPDVKVGADNNGIVLLMVEYCISAKCYFDLQTYDSQARSVLIG